MSDMDEFKQIFFTECAELLADMEERLLKLDEGSQDADQLNAIFRCAHSIKGGSGAFGMNAIMHFTHKLEALLDAMRNGDIVPTRGSINALLKSADIVTNMLAAAQEGREPEPGYGDDVVAILEAFAKGEEAPAASPVPVPAPVPAPAASAEQGGEYVELPPSSQTPGMAQYFIHMQTKKNLLATGNEPLLIFRELASLGELTVEADTTDVPFLSLLDPISCNMHWTMTLNSEAPESRVREVFEFIEDLAEIAMIRDLITPAEGYTADVVEAPVAQPSAPAAVEAAAAPAIAAAKPAAKPAAGAPAAASAASSIRVDIEKIDRLVNMVGELVITEAMLRSQVRHLPDDKFAALMQGMDELSHHTRELQEAVMSVRMQPVKSIFSRMPRIVRDTAAQLGKDVQLILSGENTEVDKTVIEQLGDPLTHMIRNSVDHGVEMPEKRIENGKPQQGTIHLSAYHRSGRIMIEITDDGAGINRARVLAKAQEKGLVAMDAQLAEEEIDQLIFLPGFSTAEQVTSVSGRGVGMDVVRKNIESIGGTVRITNTPGKGSIFSVSLPLTLAILDGMIVGVGAETYIVPISNIIETMRPKASDIHRVQGRADVINVRGEFVPIVYLYELFNVQNAQQNLDDTLIVLVESGSQKMGLVVDELLGQQQVVIKSLEANADPVKGISGATILGDGKVSLILEINDLWGMSRKQTASLAA